MLAVQRERAREGKMQSQVPHDPPPAKQNLPELPDLPDSPADNSPSDASLADERRSGQIFQFLQQSAPKLWAMRLMIGLNVGVYVLMVVSGVAPFSPLVGDLIAWGGNYGPSTSSGQLWRLLSCQFLHAGLLHIAANVYSLIQIGPLVERMYGSTAFLFAYILAGTCGSLLSVAVHPDIVSVGASGAVFGVFGLLAASLLRNHVHFPANLRQGLWKSLSSVLVINLIFGFSQPQIDMSAHIGGLLGGFLIGLPLALPLQLDSLPLRPQRTKPVVAVAIGLIGFLAFLLPQQFNWQAALENVNTVESATLPRYEAARRQVEAGKLAEAELATLVENEIGPSWQKLASELAKAPAPHGKFAKGLSALVVYTGARSRHFALTARYLRAHDPAVKAELDAAAALFAADLATVNAAFTQK